MRYCGYITREGKFIDLNKKYPDLEEIWMSKHTRFEEDFGIDEDYILIVGQPNSICISAKDIPLLSRVALGNLMINGSKIKRIVKV